MSRPILGSGALFGAMLGAALSIQASTQVQAADMPFAAEAPAPVNEEIFEWGSNWYLRGDLGIAGISPTSLNGVILSNSFPNNWTIGLGGGYKFNNFFRADVTVDYESLYNRNAIATELGQPCRIGAYLAVPTDPTSITSINSWCTPNVRNRTEAMVVMGNAYFDLGTWYGLTPYIGAGVGVNVLYQQSAQTWYMSNGVPYAGVTWTDPRPNGTTYMENWDSRFQGTYLRFAYAFMGGVSYDFDENWKVDVGYRFVNLGKINGVDRWNVPVARDLIGHQVRVGFRYMIN